MQSSRPRTNAFCAPVTQNHLPKTDDLMLQNANVSGNQRPDLLTSLTENASFSDPRQMSHACHRFWKCYKTLTFCSLLTKSTIPLPLPRETTSERPKMLRTLQFFAFLTSKCASRHNGVHFFDISTSKSALNPSVFYTFDFEMCFAPQPRAIFHLSSGQLAPQFSTLRSHKSLEKHNPTFSRTWIFFLLRLFFSDPCARKGRKVAKHCVFSNDLWLRRVEK